MNREVLFRGQRIDNNEWVYGDLVHDYWIQRDKFLKTAIRYLINGIYSFPIEVTPETVGQFTGLTDKNGVKVFEGDELECDFYHASWWWYNNPQPTGHDGYSSVRGICSVNHFGEICKIRFTEYSFWFDEYEDLEDKINKYHLGTKINNNSNAVVIGNIHEKK